MNGIDVINILAKLETMEQGAIEALIAAIATKQPLPGVLGKIPVATLPAIEGALKLFLAAEDFAAYFLPKAPPAPAAPVLGLGQLG